MDGSLKREMDAAIMMMMTRSDVVIQTNREMQKKKKNCFSSLSLVQCKER